MVEYSITTPRFPPAPRRPKHRSGSLWAVTLRRIAVPLDPIVTTSIDWTKSAAAPCHMLALQTTRCLFMLGHGARNKVPSLLRAHTNLDVSEHTQNDGYIDAQPREFSSQSRIRLYKLLMSITSKSYQPFPPCKVNPATPTWWQVPAIGRRLNGKTASSTIPLAAPICNIELLNLLNPTPGGVPTMSEL